MAYDEITGMTQPVKIRAHHLFAFQNFISYRGSVMASIAVWEPRAEAGNFGGYGKPFIINEAQTWLYLSRNQGTHVKVTDKFDVLCAKCRKLETCDEPARLDEIAANVLGVEIGNEYTVKEILGTISKAAAGLPEDDRNRLGV